MGVCVGDELALKVVEPVGVIVGVTLELRVVELVGVRVPDLEGVWAGEFEAVLVGVCVGVELTLNVVEPVGVIDGVPLPLTLVVGEGVGELLGVRVGVGVLL